MRTLRRLKFMSSPSLSDLGKREPAAAADERGTQQRRACANATWNSIHNGVIAVFQRKGLPDQELFSLNEGVRQLLKTELGSFFTEYLQNQLLTKGMVILRDKIRFYEGQKLLDSLAETWDFFFSDVLPMLQAIFYPVQGKEPSVRQLALLHFRNAITLSVKLEDALARAHARVPPAIVQMLLVLQGVHESRGVTEDYLRLETLVQKVVSPYLGTYGLHSSEGPFTHSCILEKRLLRRSRSGDVLAKNPVVRSKSYNTPLLNPVQEHEAEGAAAGGTSIRRHSVSEMTSCPEPQGFSDPPGQGPTGTFRSSPAPHSGPCPSRLYPTTQPPEQGLDPIRSSLPRSSPENLVDQILESVDSDSEGIFIDFGRGRGSGMSDLEGSGGRQSVV
ncbi:proline-rich protein 5 isoform X1 [Gorilla gorilla gorilla]|uniref:proline-rich protein 5 isoform X1 n=2 Tax=Gorilla gorilla gorilla TaxID=9595 RepID=UPI002445FB19|nr:proline-rich protein 5 isoform X1 [Gorilla gorilla gorilla]